MAEPTLVSWTPANWITVVLMVGLAFLIVGATARIIQQKKANAGS